MKTNRTFIFLAFVFLAASWGDQGNGYGKGIRPALFSYNTLKDEGAACFDDFTMKFN